MPKPPGIMTKDEPDRQRLVRLAAPPSKGRKKHAVAQKVKGRKVQVYAVPRKPTVGCFLPRYCQTRFQTAPFLRGQTIVLQGFNRLGEKEGNVVVPAPYPAHITLSQPPTEAETALAAHYQEVQQMVVEVRMGIDSCLEVIQSSKEATVQERLLPGTTQLSEVLTH